MIKCAKAILAAGFMAALAVLFLGSIGRAQTGGVVTGTISGTVTANRDYALSEASGKHIPALVAVRVRARDIDRHIVYTVFTNKGHYTIYNLPPGNYQMSALQDSFDSTTPNVELKAGETKTADVALKGRPDHLRAELVDYDTLYPPGPRRPTVDSKGMVWFSEHIGQSLGVLNPDTGKITEYKDPYPYFGGYECYADSKDNIWVTLRSYGVIAKFAQKTKKYTYYPEPFPDIMGREHPGPHGTLMGGLYPPKIEEGEKGTFWYTGIGMHYLVAFKPEGNVPHSQRAEN